MIGQHGDPTTAGRLESPVRRNAIAYPLAQEPFLTANRTESGVKGQRIGTAARVHVGKIESVSGRTAMSKPDLREIGLPAIEVVVKVDEEGYETLPSRSHLFRKAGFGRVDEVVVQIKSLSGRIVRDLREFHNAHRQARRLGDPRANKEQRDVRLHDVEIGLTVCATSAHCRAAVG